MSSGKPLTSVSAAMSVIGQTVRALPTHRVPLAEATGLTLAEQVRTDMDYPPFDRSMMDGFAVRSEDFVGESTILEVVGEVAAGEVADLRVERGQALRINTGAPIPRGADAVVIIERVELLDSGRRVKTSDRPKPHQHIASRGSAAHAGQVVLEAGRRLGPAQIAAAAAAGAAEVAVYRRPRLAVLVTGDELVAAGARPAEGQIRNSNGPCLLALAAESGCEVVDLGVVGDDRDLLAARVREGLKSDLLCLTGGLSMGQHDYVPAILAEAGVRTAVQKISIKPGKPTLFGIGPGHQVVFGLPGNPVSCLVCFLLFVRAALSAMQGRAAVLPPMVLATLKEHLATAGPREEYLPARLEQTQRGQWSVAPVRWTGSGDPFGAATADGLLVRDPHSPAAGVGELVPVVPLEL